MYDVSFDYAPAYELFTSYYLYANRRYLKSLDLGKEWAERLDRHLPPGFKARIEPRFSKYYKYLLVLIWRRQSGGDVPSFLAWLTSLSSGDMFEILSPYMKDSLTKELASIRDYYVDILSEWDAEYFRKAVSAAHHQALAESVVTRVDRAMGESSVETVDETTNGIYIEPRDLEEVVLIPSIHTAPSAVWSSLEKRMLVQYAIDTAPIQGHVPAKSLTRVTKALADEHRLSMLKYLDGAPRSFAEIMDFVGLSKTATHYHLSLLRLAGVVRTHINLAEGIERFTRRPRLIQRVDQHLVDYFGDVVESP